MRREHRQQTAPAGGGWLFEFGRVASFALLIWAVASISGAQDWNIEVVGQVGGGCLGVKSDGNYAYIGEGPNLTVLDVSGTSNPAPVERIRFKGTISDVFLSGNRVYAAGWVSGLQIIDVSNPQTPAVIGSFKTNAYSVYVSNNRAYVSLAQGGVQIINVTQPTTPVLMGSIPGTGFVHNIWVSGNRAYLAGLQTGLHVYDVTQPSTPVLKVSYMGAQYAWDVVTSGSLAYVAGSELYIVNFSNVTSPTLLATHTIPGNGMSICRQGNRVYVGTTSGSLHIVDVTLPTSPTRLGTWTGAVLPASVCVVGNTAYVCDAHRGLYVLDVSNPASPRRTGFYGTPIGVHVIRIPSASKAHIAAYDFYTLDINDPSNPTVYNIYETAHELAGLDTSGNNAFLTHEIVLELLILNIGDPSSPTMVGRYVPGQTLGGGLPRLAGPKDYPANAGPKVDVRGNMAIVSGFTSGALDLVDIGQPANARRRGLYPMHSFVGDIDIDGNTAFISNGEKGFKILDVSDMTSPRLVGCFPSAWALSFHRSAGSGQIGDGGEGVWLVNINDLSSPTLLSRYLCPGRTYGVDEGGYLLYTASAEKGLQVIDISRPTSPTLCGRFNSEGLAVDVRLQGSLIYLADKYTGLWILRYTGPIPRGPGTLCPRWPLYR